MNKIYISLLLCSYGSMHANIGPQGFKDYLNYYFVETGSFTGNAIARALREGFKEIRSIESDQRLYNNVKKRFADHVNVIIARGDSATDLWDLIKDIDQEATFWLDAHIYPPKKGARNCPLIQELEQIRWHFIKTHTILIDDMHCAGTEAFDGLTKEDLIKKIKEINAEYVITYMPGGDDGEYPQNVMVAYIPK